jgi:hypothetical protein
MLQRATVVSRQFVDGFVIALLAVVDSLLASNIPANAHLDTKYWPVGVCRRNRLFRESRHGSPVRFRGGQCMECIAGTARAENLVAVRLPIGDPIKGTYTGMSTG